MSALGDEQTSRHVGVMSVIPLKADIHSRGLRPLCANSGHLIALAALATTIVSNGGWQPAAYS